MNFNTKLQAAKQRVRIKAAARPTDSLAAVKAFAAKYANGDCKFLDVNDEAYGIFGSDGLHVKANTIAEELKAWGLEDLEVCAKGLPFDTDRGFGPQDMSTYVMTNEDGEYIIWSELTGTVVAMIHPLD